MLWRKVCAHQKVTRLANCSEFVWSLVTEYDIDELIDDSDNGRKIEMAAERLRRSVGALCSSLLVLSSFRLSIVL